MNAPYPRPDPVEAMEIEFWSYLAAGELRAQRCGECGTYRHPPRLQCAACGSANVEWVAVTGRGEVWAATSIHPPTLPAFAERTPYNAVVVRLDEGVFMVGNVVDEELIAIGTPVEVVIVEVEAGLRLAHFRRS